VTVKLVGYLTDEIGGEEESSCGRFFWGLIPEISLRLLEEKKIRISSFWGQLWTRDLLVFGHNVRTPQLVSAVLPKYWYSPTTLNTATTVQTTPNVNLHENVQHCILLVKIDGRDSAVGIGTRYGLLARFRNSVGSSISAKVQTGHETK